MLTNNQCESDSETNEIPQCKSAKRIKTILNKFNEIMNNESQNQSNVNNISYNIIKLIHNKYNNTKLLNDFHHIKYVHGADSDDKQQEFSKIYEYFKDCKDKICSFDASNCKHIDRHYMDRSKLQNQYILDNNDEIDIDDQLNNQYTIQLISRIHVYFLHSYDINKYRLSLDEMNIIDKQLNYIQTNDEKEKRDDDDLLEDKRIEITTDIINKRQNSLNIEHNNDKYVEQPAESDDSLLLNVEAIGDILKNHNISVEKSQLKFAFENYKNDKNKFINDIIEAYYGNTDDLLPISNNILINHLSNDHETRNKIYEYILYDYIKKTELNNTNFIKIAAIIICATHSEIEIEKFTQIATKSNIDGRIFDRNSDHFKNSAKFAKLFESMPNFKKKQFTQIYTKINKWKPIQFKYISNNIKSEEIKDFNEENKTEEKQTEPNDIYVLGKRFYFWDSMKNHKHFIKPNHPNLKDEMLQNKIIEFDQKRWKSLYNECKTDVETDIVKAIRSNGYYKSIYNISTSSPFDIDHLCALKLYTDYTKECGIFCSILRSENTSKVKEIANWSKYLTQCVQCYGSPLKESKIKKYYRGIKSVFKFKMIVARFNLPTSTTINFQKAADFAAESGLILELRYHKSTYSYDVFKLDCSKISGYDYEKETLFFGGDTVLRISSMWQCVNRKWNNYRKYMEPLNGILRMINGLSIREQRIASNAKQQQIMYELMNHVFCTFNSRNSMMDLPLYIEELLKYHISNVSPWVKLNFDELMNEYKWLRSILKKHKHDTETLNISHISQLFRDCNGVKFLMPNEYILSDPDILSLIEDLGLVSAMDIDIVINLEWSSSMSPINKLRVDEYQKQLSQINWTRRYSTNSILFECIESLLDTVYSQQRIRSILFPQSPKPRSIGPFNDFPDIKITKKDIGKHPIYTVEGYIGRIKLYIPQIIEDLMLFYYAKPIIINIKYEEQKTYILHCPITDGWDSVRVKIENKLKTCTRRVIALQHGHENPVNRNNWNSLQLYEQEIYLVCALSTIEQLKSEMICHGVSADDIDKFQEKIDEMHHDLESIKEDISDKGQSMLLDFFRDDTDGGQLTYYIVKAIINGEEYNEVDVLCRDFDELLSGHVLYWWEITKQQNDMIVSWIKKYALDDSSNGSFKLDDNVKQFFDLLTNKTEIIVDLPTFANLKNGSCIEFIVNSVEMQKMSDDNDYNLIKPSIIFKLFSNVKEIIIRSTYHSSIYAFNVLTLLSILTSIAVPPSLRKIIIKDEYPTKSGEWLKNEFSKHVEKEFISQKLQITFKEDKEHCVVISF